MVVTTRAEAKWEAVIQGIRKAGIDFKMINDPEDADFVAIQTAYLTRTPVELAIMDGAIDDTSSEGLRATFAVLKFPRNEELDAGVATDITIKPTRAAQPPEWINGDAGWTPS